MVARLHKPIDPISIGTSTVALIDEGDAPVPGSAEYDPHLCEVRFIPDAELALDRAYTFTVRGGKKGIRDVSGLPLRNRRTLSGHFN